MYMYKIQNDSLLTLKNICLLDIYFNDDYIEIIYELEIYCLFLFYSSNFIILLKKVRSFVLLPPFHPLLSLSSFFFLGWCE